jgi:hypothetical protein
MNVQYKVYIDIYIYSTDKKLERLVALLQKCNIAQDTSYKNELTYISSTTTLPASSERHSRPIVVPVKPKVQTILRRYASLPA